jgi:hypothetical protein
MKPSFSPLQLDWERLLLLGVLYLLFTNRADPKLMLGVAYLLL